MNSDDSLLGSQQKALMFQGKNRRDDSFCSQSDGRFILFLLLNELCSYFVLHETPDTTMTTTKFDGRRGMGAQLVCQSACRSRDRKVCAASKLYINEGRENRGMCLPSHAGLGSLCLWMQDSRGDGGTNGFFCWCLFLFNYLDELPMLEI